MVRQHAGADDVGDSRPCGVYDGIAAHGEGPGRHRDTAQEADWSDVCPCSDASHEGTVLPFSAEIRPRPDDALSRTVLPDWGRGLERSGGVLQLAEQGRGDT